MVSLIVIFKCFSNTVGGFYCCVFLLMAILVGVFLFLSSLVEGLGAPWKLEPLPEKTLGLKEHFGPLEFRLRMVANICQHL